MQYLTFTELRTKAKKLAEALNRGEEVRLIRKSKTVGRILPEIDNEFKTIDVKKLEKKIQGLDLPHLTLKEIDRRYRAAMMKKHGQGISGH
jgi:antitoxin (DNA-binding transcriptional repressor) of toxin-antitoxin stability system